MEVPSDENDAEALRGTPKIQALTFSCDLGFGTALRSISYGSSASRLGSPRFSSRFLFWRDVPKQASEKSSRKAVVPEQPKEACELPEVLLVGAPSLGTLGALSSAPCYQTR